MHTYASCSLADDMLTPVIVNGILGDHNVDKQISDSKGDVSTFEVVAWGILAWS